MYYSPAECEIRSTRTNQLHLIILDVILEPQWNAKEDKIAFYNSTKRKLEIFHLSPKQPTNSLKTLLPKEASATGEKYEQSREIYIDGERYHMCSCQPTLGKVYFELWKIFFIETTADFVVGRQQHKRYYLIPPVYIFPWILLDDSKL